MIPERQYKLASSKKSVDIAHKIIDFANILTKKWIKITINENFQGHSDVEHSF